jgi:hypothetical protein
MQHRVEFTHAANAGLRRCGRRLWQAALRWAAAALIVAVGTAASADEMMPGMDSVVDPGAPPMTDFGGGEFFSQDLGTTLRIRYSTESYGQHGDGHGNLDLGTMQVATFDDAAVFFDGQVTLNDVQGVGFNLGVGYRWLAFQPYAGAPGRMQGVSIWADGTSTEAHNFFPQLGVSYESLGEMWDLRANTYIPLGAQDQVGKFVPTGEIGFEGNNISELAQAVVDSSFFAGEAEFARRLGVERDAWVFAGPYFLANDIDDTAGYRVGLRGYAYPDLLLQIAVSDDDIFNTNATFSLVWFVGRTRTDYRPACGVPDRFREPVMRNDYVVLAQSTAAGGIPLTQPDGSALRVVHVNSNAAPGGDGTFENPFDMLSDVDDPGNSFAGDIIFVHAESMFTGQGIALKNNQRLLGEGLDADGDPLVHTVATAEEGTIDIPQSSPGARNRPRPMIVDAPGDTITLASGNEAANFDIDGGNRAIFGTNLSGASNIHDISVVDALANAIALDNATANVTLRNIDVTNGNGFGISLSNIAAGISVTLSQYEYDGGAAAAGGIQMNNFDGTFTASNSSLTNGTLAGVAILNDSDGNITFQNTVMFDSIDGTAFDVNGFTGTLSVNSDITNDTGRSVSLQGVSLAGTSLVFNGDIMDTGQGILVSGNSGGTILFSGDVTLTTAGNTAVQLTSNTGADISFGGPLVISTTTGTGFEATGGGTLTASNTNNTITTETGRVAQITGMTISNAGATFGDIRRTVAGAVTNAVQLEDNTGGPIVLGTLGDTAGASGVLEGGTADAIRIANSANVTVSGIEINNTNNVAGVRVVKNTANTMTLNLNDLQIDDGGSGIEVSGSAGAGALNMTVNDTALNGQATTGLSFDTVSSGTIQVNNATVDGNNAAATAGIRVANSNASFTFDDDTIVQEVSGTAFDVQGGAGTITMNGDITNTAGRSINVQSISGGTVTFGTTNQVTDTGAGARVANNTGGTISFLGNYNLNTSTNDAVTISTNTGATVSIGQLDIDTTTGDGFVATGGGTLSVLGNANTITSAGGRGLNIENMTIGSVDFESVNATGGDNGVRLVDNANGTITIGDTGAAANAGGTISGTTDAGVHVTNSNVVLNGLTVQNAGNAAGENAVEIFHTNAVAMNANLNRLTVSNATAARDGVVIDGTGGSGTFNANLQNLSVNVTGDGLAASNGVTLTAGGTNTINSDTGVGLQLTDVTISGSSANFQSVTVTNGATNGVVMQNVASTGGSQVAITGTGTTTNSGGSLTTAGDAVLLSDVQNVDLRNLRIINSATGINVDHTTAATATMDVTVANLNLDGATADGINVLAANDAVAFTMRLTDGDLESNVAVANTGAGQFTLLVEDTDIDASGADIAFSLAFSGNATDGDVTIRDNNRFAGDTGQALFVDTFDATSKDIKLLIEDSMFLSNGADPAADIRARGNTLMSLTVQGNQFDSPGAADDLDIQSNGAQARMRLALGGDDPSDFNSANGAGTMIVRELGGSDFRIFEVVDTITNDTRNFDPVDSDPNDAAFQNLAVPPALPTVPLP